MMMQKSDIKLVYLYSDIKMMHGPIRIRKLYVDVIFGSKVKDFIFMFLCACVGICK